MMQTGRRRWLGSERSLPCDILHFSRKVPISRAEAEIDLTSIVQQRSVMRVRISWTALFLKAYGVVCDNHECLRQTYMPWPIPHLYQHGVCVATVAMQREHAGRPRLCWARFIDPGNNELLALQDKLNRLASEPTSKAFRKQLRLSRLPRFLRRAAWWTTLNVSGRVRQRQVGTCSISSLAGVGVNNRDHPTVCTSSLSYGPIDPHGRALITLVYDHRVMDGMQAAQALRGIEECMAGQISGELAEISVSRAAA